MDQPRTGLMTKAYLTMVGGAFLDATRKSPGCSLLLILVALGAILTLVLQWTAR
jgi:hypothetical protein